MRSLVLALVLLGARGLAAQCPPQASTDSVSLIGNTRVRLRIPDVSRDFMPLKNTADGGSDLRVGFAFENPDSGKVRVGVSVRRAWVRYHGDWAPLSIDAPWTSSDSLQVVWTARRGPPWPAGSLIDVLVEWQPDSGLLHCTLFQRLRIEAEI